MNNKKFDLVFILCIIEKNKKIKKFILYIFLNFLIWLSYKFKLFFYFLNILVYKFIVEILLKLFKSYIYFLF